MPLDKIIFLEFEFFSSFLASTPISLSLSFETKTLLPFIPAIQKCYGETAALKCALVTFCVASYSSVFLVLYFEHELWLKKVDIDPFTKFNFCRSHRACFSTMFSWVSVTFSKLNFPFVSTRFVRIVLYFCHFTRYFYHKQEVFLIIDRLQFSFLFCSFEENVHV